MDADSLQQACGALRSQPAEAIVRWALERAAGRAVVTTNFRPYEAVLLHLVTRVQPGIPVLWVDHGYNRPATYRHAAELRRRLELNLQTYVPRMTAAHYDAVEGGLPECTPANEERLRAFSAVMKLEPFERAMREQGPAVWFTALRRSQNPHRAQLDVLSPDPNFGTLKVCPLFYWADADLEEYLRRHDLPNEWDYFDPAKADEKRECGLHVPWAKTSS